jgi:hypothetical protein
MNNSFELYNVRTHRIGRLVCALCAIMFLGAPFLMGAVLGGMPDMGAFGRAMLAVGPVWIISSIAEYLIYTPMLGAGGGYLAFITGNLINMKIPCALNARDIVGTQAGTTENEIVSTISVAASSLVTTVVIALGVLLLIPLRPVLENPALQPAFDNVVPALFGAMAYKYFRRGKKLVALPLIVMIVLFVCVPSLIGSVGFLMLISGAIAIAQAFYVFKKGAAV